MRYEQDFQRRRFSWSQLQRNMAGAAALVALRAVAHECQLVAPSFSDEQASRGLAITGYAPSSCRQPRHKRLSGCCSCPPS